VTVEDIPGFAELSDHDKDELRKFEKYITARTTKPATAAYADTYGVRAIPDGHARHECQWQECRAVATCARDTRYGDLFVCDTHATAPLDDEGPDR
jgi:hypothetical protein